MSYYGEDYKSGLELKVRTLFKYWCMTARSEKFKIHGLSEEILPGLFLLQDKPDSPIINLVYIELHCIPGKEYSKTDKIDIKYLAVRAKSIRKDSNKIYIPDKNAPINCLPLRSLDTSMLYKLPKLNLIDEYLNIKPLGYV